MVREKLHFPHQTGKFDAHRLREAGVKITYRCHFGMIHLFYGMGALIPYAATAYRQMGADIRSMLAFELSP